VSGSADIAAVRATVGDARVRAAGGLPAADRVPAEPIASATSVGGVADASTPQSAQPSRATSLGHVSARTAQLRVTSTAVHSGRRRRTSPALGPLPTGKQPSVIPYFVSVVPSAIWLALGLAVGLAGAAGAVALTVSRRARRQAGELAAASAAAQTDALTDALNRRGFAEAVERELARARRYEGHFVLAYLDVRGLKALNDTKGHSAGDALLREVAHLLKDSAREADVVGRIGGDEFSVLLTEQPAETAEAVTRRIRERVAVRRNELGLSVPWDLTIGTAAYPHDGHTFDELMATADRRLYEQRGIDLGAGGRAS
jgi:diguanylate cyclase (GGDEF)-like protein